MKTFEECWKWINARGSVITVQEEHELRHIFDLMRACDCQSYLEVGTAEGNSLYVLGHAVSPTGIRGAITFVDFGEKHTRDAIKHVVGTLFNETGILPLGYCGDSTNPITFIKCDDMPQDKYDCILIDGGHDFATVLSDSILYAPLATKYVFWHDIQLPEVRAAVEWFEKRYSHLGEFSSFTNSDSFGYRVLKVKQ